MAVSTGSSDEARGFWFLFFGILLIELAGAVWDSGRRAMEGLRRRLYYLT
ncbi:MAG: hypothetical protein ABI837_06505 [Acidobacteriota bacterium]